MNEFENCKDETEWQTVKIENKEYLLKFVYENNLWKVIVTDFIYLWLEELTHEMIKDRCIELNPALDIDAFDAKSYINELLQNIIEYATEISLECINLSKEIEGGIFKFCIKLKKGNPVQLWEHVTKKLCQSINVVTYRNKTLIELIKKKDEEILEYKLEGAQLIRKNIETEVFNENQFNEMIVESDCLNIQSGQSMLNFCKYVKVKTEPVISQRSNIEELNNKDEHCTLQSEIVITKKESPSTEDNKNDKSDANTIQRHIQSNDTEITTKRKGISNELFPKKLREN